MCMCHSCVGEYPSGPRPRTPGSRTSGPKCLTSVSRSWTSGSRSWSSRLKWGLVIGVDVLSIGVEVPDLGVEVGFQDLGPEASTSRPDLDPEVREPKFLGDTRDLDPGSRDLDPEVLDRDLEGQDLDPRSTTSTSRSNTSAPSLGASTPRFGNPTPNVDVNLGVGVPSFGVHFGQGEPGVVAGVPCRRSRVGSTEMILCSFALPPRLLVASHSARRCCRHSASRTKQWHCRPILRRSRGP